MKYRKTLIWTLSLSLAFSVGFVSDVSDNYFEISKNLDIFGKLYREINSLYVDDTDPSQLMRTGIDAMLNSLDPYTNYISEEEVEDFRFMSTGQYGGIGALIGKRGGKILVLEPYKDYPAAKAGLQAGDELIRVDGKALDGSALDISDIRNLLRGEKGSSVILEVQRPGQSNTQKFQIDRDRIKINNVSFQGMANERIGYIALSGFTQDAGREVQQATQALKEKNPNLQGIILDLRGNPGGRLDQSVQVANVFIPQKEVIVETRGRMDGSKKTHIAQKAPIDTEIPLAVLVNHRSASASEIVAGAIQDLDRGVIIGRRSFGKGLVQNIRPLAYNTQLKVTTAKYYTPSGRCIQAINYATRSDNGSLERIPDSLKSAFKTRNGRTVYDGGGIEPDVIVAEANQHIITEELGVQGLIFDYATHFVGKNDQIASASSFNITDGTYKDFADYVRQQNFDYDTEANRELNELVEVVSDESYSDYLSDDLNSLEEKINAQKDKDLMKHQQEISRLLRKEIVQRYYYEEGALESSLRDDPDVLKAVEILENSSRYEQILKKPSR